MPQCCTYFTCISHVQYYSAALLKDKLQCLAVIVLAPIGVLGCGYIFPWIFGEIVSSLTRFEEKEQTESDLSPQVVKVIGHLPTTMAMINFIWFEKMYLRNTYPYNTFFFCRFCTFKSALTHEPHLAREKHGCFLLKTAQHMAMCCVRYWSSASLT